MKHKAILKKLLALTLSCGMLAATLTGCGNSNNKETESAVSQTPSSSVAEKVESEESKSSEVVEEAFDPKTITDGVKLTIAVPTDAKISTFNDNQQTKMIEEAFGVELEFMEIPKADYNAKVELMVKSGDELPDIIFNVGDYSGWIEEGAIAELSEFYANPDYCPNILEGIERSGVDVIMQMTQPNGEIYAIPKLIYSPFSAVPKAVYLNKTWCDQLGIEVPDTLDELYAACKKVAETDMNGNGKDDEIPILGNKDLLFFEKLMSGFIYAYDKEYRVVEDGKISFAYTSDEWKEGLKYIKNFVDEGLIPEDVFSMASDQQNALFDREEEPVAFICAGGTTSNMEVAKNFIQVFAFEGPDGLMVTAYEPAIASAGAVITADCKNPLAAFLVCDFMCSAEQSIISRYGQPGVDWDYWDIVKSKVDESEFAVRFEGFDTVFAAYDIIDFWASTDPHDHCLRQKGPTMLDQTLAGGIGLWVGSDDEAIRDNAITETERSAAASQAYNNYLPKEVVGYAPFTAEETEQVADIKTSLTTYVDEMITNFLTGKNDIDADWDSYLKELERIGYKEYLEVIQTAYDRVRK